MFNLRPKTGLPGFRVGQPEDQPGFAIDENGEGRSALPIGFNVPDPGNEFYGDAVQPATGVGDTQPAASADDPQGLKMANAAAREAGLDTPELRQKFHRAISGQGITSYQELLNIARQIKAGTY
jgi:hypothetical protein